MKDTSPPLILHVIHHLAIGGLENGLVNLINQLPAAKYRHAIACVEDYSDFRTRIARPDVEVFALHRSRIGVWRLRREIFLLCRRLRPAVVHSRNQSGLDALLPARFAGVRRCIHGEHGWDVDNLDGTKKKPIILRQLHSPLIDRYVVVSRHLEAFLAQRVGINPKRISQIYNGVDTERFAPAAEPRVDGLPASLQGDGVVRFGTVGRIQPVKDQATLLRAFAEVLARRPDLRAKLRLMVIGDGPLLADLRQLAEVLQVAGQTWFAGAQRNIPELLGAMDVFVLPSLNEGISNTILEAMAAGLPVVATGVGGNLELVDEGVCGRLFPPQDVAALARHLEDYAADPDLRQAHGCAARQRVFDKFSLRAMVAQYEAVYDAACSPSL